jgi:hypothetical protein
MSAVRPAAGFRGAPVRRRAGKATAVSSWLDARKLNHVGPLLGVVGNELGECGGRARQCREAQFCKPCLRLTIGKPNVDLLVELVYQLGRCIPGCADAIPRARLVARNEFAYCRDIR